MSTARPIARLLPDALPQPCLEAFLSGQPDERLRDLLAFALAVETGPPADRDALRAKAEAELDAMAFRRLHNQVEAIRLEAAREQLAGLRGGPGFLRLVAAQLVALGLVAGLALLLWRQGLLPMIGI
ncbi:hypothetical protein ACVFYP_17400 [Roseomonas sp. F4]